MSQPPQDNVFGRIDEPHEPGRRRNRALELLAEEKVATARREESSQGAAAPDYPRADDASAFLIVQTEQIADLLDERRRELTESKTRLDDAWDELRLAETETKEWIAKERQALLAAAEEVRVDRDELRARRSALDAAEASLAIEREHWLRERSIFESKQASADREQTVRERGLIDWEDRLKSFQAALETLEARRRETAREATERLRGDEQRAVARAAQERVQIERLSDNQRRRRAALDERERRLAAAERSLASRDASRPSSASPEEWLDAESLRQEAAELLREALQHRLAIGELWSGLMGRVGATQLNDALEDIRRRLARETATEQRRLAAALTQWRQAVGRATTKKSETAAEDPQPFFGS